MQVIIIAAGNGSRWGDYLGVPKHMVPIFGKPLLQDTIDKFYGHDITVVCNEELDVTGCRFEKVELNPENFDADKFLNNAYLWNKDGRTVILYGDVYFTETAVLTIKADLWDWCWYSRYGAGTYTGKDWGENFAIAFWPQHHDKLKEALSEVVRFNKENVTERSGGWELYRQMAGIPLNEHAVKGNFINIDDLTDDFDYPEDYDKWLEKWT
jgi:hypothetical protein